MPDKDYSWAEVASRVGSSSCIVTLCGSTRFGKEYREAFDALMSRGHVVLTRECFLKVEGRHLTKWQKRVLDIVHKHKIAISDAILVLNVGGYVGYIGESTRNEIAHAQYLGKRIVYLEQVGETE